MLLPPYVHIIAVRRPYMHPNRTLHKDIEIRGRPFSELFLHILNPRYRLNMGSYPTSGFFHNGWTAPNVIRVRMSLDQQIDILRAPACVLEIIEDESLCTEKPRIDEIYSISIYICIKKSLRNQKGIFSPCTFSVICISYSYYLLFFNYKPNPP